MVLLHLKTLGKHHLPHSALRFGTLQRLSPTFCFPRRVVKASRHKVVKASPRVQTVRASRHKVAKASRHVQTVKTRRAN